MLYLVSLHSRLGLFLQAVVEESPTEEGDMCSPSEGVFGSNEEGGLTPLDLNWEELTYSRMEVKVYEHSGAKPTPHSTFRLRYVPPSPCFTSAKLAKKSKVQARGRIQAHRKHPSISAATAWLTTVGGAKGQKSKSWLPADFLGV